MLVSLLNVIAPLVLGKFHIKNLVLLRTWVILRRSTASSQLHGIVPTDLSQSSPTFYLLAVSKWPSRTAIIWINWTLTYLIIFRYLFQAPRWVRRTPTHPSVPCLPTSYSWVIFQCYVKKCWSIFLNTWNRILSCRPEYFYWLGEKRAEVKEANPDYKIGDIAKVSLLPMYFLGIHVHVTEFFWDCYVAGYRADVEGAGRERKGNGSV